MELKANTGGKLLLNHSQEDKDVITQEETIMRAHNPIKTGKGTEPGSSDSPDKANM